MWMVAPSYQNAKITKVDEATRKAYVEETCWKCGGSGSYAWFGVCFKCNGAGKIGKWVKAYTEPEYEKYLKNQEKRKEQAAAAEKQRRENLIIHSEENKKVVFEKLGYNPEAPFVYIVIGNNTYNIKDELKASGFRFNKTFGWYATKKIEVPEGYDLLPVDANKLFNWDPLLLRLDEKDEAKDIINKAINDSLPPSKSEYVGEIKERLKNLNVILDNYRSIEGFYGTSIIYTFKQSDNIFIWITSGKGISEKINIGDNVILTGTVKDHKEYKGIKQTILTRCIVKTEGI